MAQISKEQVVPALHNLAKTEKDKRRKETVENLAETVDAVLSEAEEVRAATRNLSILTQKQRDSLHNLIKDYSKMIDDVDKRNEMLREAGRIVRSVN